MPGASRGSDGAQAKQALGRRAEALVCAHLEREGFTILARNERVGRLEIDVIARRSRLLVFCEVRARRSDAVMMPTQSLAGRKAHAVRRAAAEWLRRNRSGDVDVRLDAASVVFDTPEGRLTYLEGAL